MQVSQKQSHALQRAGSRHAEKAGPVQACAVTRVPNMSDLWLGAAGNTEWAHTCGMANSTDAFESCSYKDSIFTSTASTTCRGSLKPLQLAAVPPAPPTCASAAAPLPCSSAAPVLVGNVAGWLAVPEVSADASFAAVRSARSCVASQKRSPSAVRPPRAAKKFSTNR
jgi:hypothetical protein